MPYPISEQQWVTSEVSQGLSHFMGSDMSKASKNVPGMLCLEYLTANIGLAVLLLAPSA